LSTLNNELDFRFPAEPDHLRVLRRMLRKGLVAMGIAESVTDRVLLVMDEIVSNAIEHGADYRQGEAPLRARVTLVEDDRLFLQFHDEDMPAEILAEVSREILNGGYTPVAGLERGRGLFLIREFLSELQVQELSGGGMLLEGFLRE
jgi:anti-sigma regulatory factor (Ser/Thr protein kinase)